jgi:hypothetical protein
VAHIMAEAAGPIPVIELAVVEAPGGNATLFWQSQWDFGGGAANLAIDAQQFAFDHMAKKLARHLDRRCTVIRFPSEKVPATLIPYLGLDESRPAAIQALINQARKDADMTNSKCAYADSDPEAALICALFDSAPARTNPLVSRKSPGGASTAMA